jgi:hypothetical protein
MINLLKQFISDKIELIKSSIRTGRRQTKHNYNKRLLID